MSPLTKLPDAAAFIRGHHLAVMRVTRRLTGFETAGMPYSRASSPKGQATRDERAEPRSADAPDDDS